MPRRQEVQGRSSPWPLGGSFFCVVKQTHRIGVLEVMAVTWAKLFPYRRISQYIGCRNAVRCRRATRAGGLRRSCRYPQVEETLKIHLTCPHRRATRPRKKKHMCAGFSFALAAYWLYIDTCRVSSVCVSYPKAHIGHPVG